MAMVQKAKYNEECLKYAIIDSLLVDELTGNDNHPFAVFEGTIPDENTILADAKYKNHNQGLEAICLRRFFSAFWKGDYAEANKWHKQASSLPSSKMPKIYLIHRTFYRGLIAFQLYRDGEGEEWLDEGKKVLDKMESWVGNNKPIFESKLILCEAEDYASMCNIVAAKESYELSAKTARDNGLIHEQGLACEVSFKIPFLSLLPKSCYISPLRHPDFFSFLMYTQLYAKFLYSISELLDAAHWMQQAYIFYTQWGAKAKARQLQEKYNIALPQGNTLSMNLSSMKHDREETI